MEELYKIIFSLRSDWIVKSGRYENGDKQEEFETLYI